MHPFEYAAPETLDQALGLLGEHGDEAKVLAGGQSLIPILHYRLARPRVVIDINRLPLGDIAVENGRLNIGALVRYHRLEESDVIARRCPVLGEAARLIGNVRVRTLGTVGGSLAHADPAAELPAVMTALDARLAVASPSGRRTVAAREFFTGPLTTMLTADEIVTGVEMDAVSSYGWAVEELSRRAGDLAVVDVIARLVLNGRLREVEVRPNQTLLEMLRDTLGIFDVKEGCDEGVCGVCTVLLDGRPVSSCLVLAAALWGRAVVTLRGLERNGGLHPLQEAFVRHGGRGAARHAPRRRAPLALPVGADRAPRHQPRRDDGRRRGRPDREGRPAQHARHRRPGPDDRRWAAARDAARAGRGPRPSPGRARRAGGRRDARAGPRRRRGDRGRVRSHARRVHARGRAASGRAACARYGQPARSVAHCTG